MIFYTIAPSKNLQDIKNLRFPVKNPSQRPSAHLKKTGSEQHQTNPALNTALYLLTENKYEYLDTVCEIIKKVCNSSFKNLNSDMYGIIPYDWEDTEDLYFEPDYDFQSYLLTCLLEIYIEYRNMLPDEITNLIKNTCITTAFILSYTLGSVDSHNSILEIICLIFIGERFDKPEILNAGIHRLHSLVYLTLYNDTLMEYNHPIKIATSIEGIMYFKNHIKNQDYHSGMQSIEHIILTCFYTHFNPKLMKWTGPISVIDENPEILSENILTTIKRITKQNDIENLKVPEEYRDVSPVTGNKFIQNLTSKGFAYPHMKFDLVASSYNTGLFALGSFNHDDMWDSRRPCIGFFGRKNSSYVMSMHCLLNNHDFSSGSFHSVQYKGAILGHIGLSLNRGYKNLTESDQKAFKMRDLRIRFNISGDTSHLEYSKKDNTLTVLYNQLSIKYQVQNAVFDDFDIKYEMNVSDNALCFDVILYSGEETTLDPKKIKKSITAFSIFMGTNKKYVIPEVKTSETKEMFISECRLSNFPIRIETPKKPGNIEYIFLHDRQYINNIRLEEYADRAKMLSGQHRFISRNNITQSQTIQLDADNENKSFVKKINSLEKLSPEKISSSIKKITNNMNDFSFNIAQRYSIQILVNLFNAVKKHDVRFENIIEKKYSQVYDKISYATKFSQIRTILTDTATKLEAEYKKLKIDTKKSQNIKKIIDIINSEYKNPDLSLQIISDRIGQSEAHLSREFHSTIGHSYSEYLLKVRIEKAKELLEKETNTEIIMKECGYVNYHTFNAAFKRYTGTTAKKYKRSISKYN